MKGIDHMFNEIFRLMTKDEIENWYKTDFVEAFSENERKPLDDIFKLIEDERYEIRGLFLDGELLGYASLWKRKEIPLVLLDYLGVKKDLRNKGIGSKILGLLKSEGFAITVESEMPVNGDDEKENDIRLHRIGFYKRNGFSEAYEMATCGMRWQAMLVNADDMDVNSVMKYHKALYGIERTDVKVPLKKDEIPEMPYWVR